MTKKMPMDNAFNGSIDEFLVTFAKRLLKAMERKTVIDENDITNLAFIILDEKLGIMDVNVNSTLFKLGLADESGAFLALPTGDIEKDLIIKKLTDMVGRGK